MAGYGGATQTVVRGTIRHIFLRHAKANVIKSISKKEAGIKLILNARMFTWLPETIPHSLTLLDNIASSIPIYDFGFSPDTSAIDAIKKVL